MKRIPQKQSTVSSPARKLGRKKWGILITDCIPWRKESWTRCRWYHSERGRDYAIKNIIAVRTQKVYR